MHKFFKVSFVIICFTLFTGTQNASATTILQTKSKDSVELDSLYFVDLKDLKDILNRISNSKKVRINEHCREEHCPILLPYEQKLVNLDRDLLEYQRYLYHSFYANKGIFKSYIDQTIANEDLKHRLQFRLVIKDGIAQMATILVDVSSVYNAIKSGNGPVKKKVLEQLTQLVQDANAILTVINTAVKMVKRDGGTDLITETTGDEDWSNLYSLLKTPLDRLAALNEYKALDAVSSSTPQQYSRARANVGAIIFQLLSVWASNERQRMKQAIKELDDLLAPSQEAYADHYHKMISKRRIYDFIEVMREAIRDKKGDMQCLFGTTEEFRYPRDSYPRDPTTFGSGLKYYKSLLDGYFNDKDLVCDLTFTCENQEYQIVVNDGMGQPFPADMEIEHEKKYKVSKEGVANTNTSFKLYPGTYSIDIMEDITNNEVIIAPVKLKGFKITGKENKIFKLDPTGGDSIRQLVLNPYGRVSLEVVNKKGEPHDFQYEFVRRFEENSEQFIQTVIKGARYNKIFLDLPAKDIMDLKLSFGFDYEETKGLKVTQNQLLELRYVYDDHKFVREEVPVNREAAKETAKAKPPTGIDTHNPIPEGWVYGTLNNSNDGSCDDLKGKYLVFVNRNSTFFNSKTGKFNESVVVAPGESIKVAASVQGGHFRAFPLTVSTDLNSRSDHISFWYASTLTEGWWYTAGCKDGTKPASSNCSNGTQHLEGVKSYSSCRTLGED